MKNKIIAVFVACCMVSGAFSLSTVSITDTSDNIINVSAVDSKKEIRSGHITYEAYYSDYRTFYASKLDSDSYYDAHYTGDSTSDIDWSKFTSISTAYGYVSAEWNADKNDMVIECGNNYSNYNCDDTITFYFEDMEFTLYVERRTMITMMYPISTSTSTTTRPTTTATTTAEKKRETKTGYLNLRPYSNSMTLYTSKLESISEYNCSYSGDSVKDIDWSGYTDISVDGKGVSVGFNPAGNDIAIYIDNYYGPLINSKITVSFKDMDFIIYVDYIMMTTVYYPNFVTTTTESSTARLITTTTTTSTTTTPVQDFRVIPSSVSMKTSDTNRLAVLGISDLSDVIWTSEDTSVATVSADGTVTAKGAGNTVIYAVYKGNVASCKINVKAGGSVVYGDANEDGKVNVADAAAIIQHIGNQDDFGLSPQGLANADTDGDGQVMGSDAIIIQRIASGELKLTDLPYKD